MPELLRIGSLFSGYRDGGLDLVVEQATGGRTVWVSDVDPGACTILAHRFPGVPNLGDITAVDWSTVEPVDVICGGSPCQDVSQAGRRAGMTEGTRSNLWVAMREAIAALRPKLVIWENVNGALSACASCASDSDLGPCPRCVDPDSGARHSPNLRALGRVLGDLASLGYDAEWVSLRAADVGACHGRRRVFVAAHPRGEHSLERGLAAPGQATGGWALGEPAGRDRAHVRLLPTPAASQFNDSEDVEVWQARRERVKATAANGNGFGMPLSIAVRLLPTPTAGDAKASGSSYPTTATHQQGTTLTDAAARQAERFSEYAPAIARQVAAFGIPAPEPTEPGKNGPRLSARFAEWMMCLPAGWVTDPAIWAGWTPTKARNAQLKALGNGVVPPQALAALQHMAARHGALTT